MKKKFFLLYLFIVSILLCGCTDVPDESKKDAPISQPKTYIVISDAHLGDQRSIINSYSWNIKMRDTLCAFLDYLTEHSNEWDELIVNGDLIDEWAAPISVPTLADIDGNILTEKEFFRNIIDANSVVFGKFQGLMEMGHKLVFIPGNHDMNTTEEDFDCYLPNIFTQARDKKGLGYYTPTNKIFIEHGHRYDIFNAPYKRKDRVDNIPLECITPPGFFVSKLNTSIKGPTIPDMPIPSFLIPIALSTMIGMDTKDVMNGNTSETYDKAWDLMYLALIRQVKEIEGTSNVATFIDGMTQTYSYKQYARSSTSTLFKDIGVYQGENGWIARCKDNDACILPPIWISIISGIIGEYLDTIAVGAITNEYEIQGVLPTLHQSKGIRVLVWGHSHTPSLREIEVNGEKCIYLNTGAWIDGESENSSTFGVIKSTNDSIVVELNRYGVPHGTTCMDRKTIHLK